MSCRRSCPLACGRSGCANIAAEPDADAPHAQEFSQSTSWWSFCRRIRSRRCAWQGQTSKNTSISAGNLRTAFTSAGAAAGISGCMPGVRNTISACSIVKIMFAQREAHAPSLLQFQNLRVKFFARRFIAGQTHQMPRARSMRISGRLLTPMPSTATRFHR